MPWQRMDALGAYLFAMRCFRAQIIAHEFDGDLLSVWKAIGS